MADRFYIDIDSEQTLRNLKSLDESRREELSGVVDSTATAIARSMRHIINSGNHFVSGALYESPRNKKTNPKMYRPIPKEERGLFRSAHPRNRVASHWTFLDTGTISREGGRGAINGIGFRERARQMHQGQFNSQVRSIANRNNEV